MAFELKRDPEFVKDRMNFLKKLKDEGESGGKDFMFRDKIQIFTPKDGDNTIRLMEGTWPGAKHYGYELWAHYQVGPSKGTFVCIEKMATLAAAKEPCPVCEEYRRALAHNEPDYAKNIRCQHKVVAYVIDRGAESRGPVIWTMPYSKVAKPIISLAYNRRTGEFLLIDDPATGRDITFTKKGKGLGTDYYGHKLDFEPSPLSTRPEQAEEWIKYTKDHPIPDLLQVRDAAYIRGVMGGGDAGDESPIIASDTARRTMHAEAEALPRAEAAGSTPLPADSRPHIISAPPIRPPVTDDSLTTRKVVSAAPIIPPTDGLTIKQIKEMNRPMLSDLITARKLDIVPDMYEEDDDLKTAVLLSLDMTES